MAHHFDLCGLVTLFPAAAEIVGNDRIGFLYHRRDQIGVLPLLAVSIHGRAPCRLPVGAPSKGTLVPTPGIARMKDGTQQRGAAGFPARKSRAGYRKNDGKISSESDQDVV